MLSQFRLTSIWRGPSISTRGSGTHRNTVSKRGSKSSASESGSKPAFPWMPLAYTTWKSHYNNHKTNRNSPSENASFCMLTYNGSGHTKWKVNGNTFLENSKHLQCVSLDVKQSGRLPLIGKPSLALIDKTQISPQNKVVFHMSKKWPINFTITLAWVWTYKGYNNDRLCVNMMKLTCNCNWCGP